METRCRLRRGGGDRGRIVVAAETEAKSATGFEPQSVVGRRGYLTFFLEVGGLSDAFGIEKLTQPMVEVEGRLATDGM